LVPYCWPLLLSTDASPSMHPTSLSH
jgi:hypothetical protein